MTQTDPTRPDPITALMKTIHICHLHCGVLCGNRVFLASSGRARAISRNPTFDFFDISVLTCHTLDIFTWRARPVQCGPSNPSTLIECHWLTTLPSAA